MAGWLRRIVGGGPGSGLPELLKTYPPYLGPFPGPGHALSLEQAQANLAHLLAHRQARLEAVLGLLAARGIETGDVLGQGDPVPFLDRLWRWIELEWPAIHSGELARRGSCRNPRGDGPEKPLSLVTDVGILLGEIILARKSGFGWALDLDPENQSRETGFVTQRQPVVFRAGNLPVGDVTYDPLGEAEDAYNHCTRPTTFWVNDLICNVKDIISGDAERQSVEREHAWGHRV